MALVAIAVVGGLIGGGLWDVWQGHERSRALADARAVASHLTFTRASDSADCRRSGTDATVFIGCFQAPYTTPAAFKRQIVRVFDAAGVPVSGAMCTTADAIDVCDIWVTHGRWHARVTSTSSPEMLSPVELRRAMAAGTPATKVLAAQPHQPWSAVLAVSRYR